MITNTWNIVQMDTYPEYEGQPDVVFNVHWNLIGTNGTYQGSVYGSTGLTLNKDATFISYADLTQEQVITWLKNTLGEEQVAAHEKSVTDQINEQVTPKVVTPPLPWSSTYILP